MVKASDAICIARSLIGTPYSELDCINLIKKIIRTGPGGVSGYTTAGTNTLWASIDAAKKYRDLTERHEGIEGVPAGALAFKRYGDALDHVGLVTGDGTVIHSSSVYGRVIESPLTKKEGWDCWAVHRYIQTSEAAEAEKTDGGEKVQNYRAVVQLANPKSYLNVRDEPGTGGTIIGKAYSGTVVTVQAQMENEWVFIAYEGGSGYVDSGYLLMINEPEAEEEKVETTILLNELTGDTVALVGRWKVAKD